MRKWKVLVVLALVVAASAGVAVSFTPIAKPQPANCGCLKYCCAMAPPAADPTPNRARVD